MRTDDIGAIERIINNKLPVEMDVGTVYSVQPLLAAVILSNRQVQNCTYDANIDLTVDDTVILVRPVGAVTWHIATVYAGRKKGFSPINRTEVDDTIGAKNIRAYQLGNNTVSLSATAWTVIESISATFSARRFCAHVNFFPSGNSTATTLYYGIQWGGTNYQCGRYYLPTTNQSAINFSYMCPYPLFGNYDIAFVAYLAGSYATSINMYNFSVYEI